MILLIDAVGMRSSPPLSSSTAPVWKSIANALRALVSMTGWPAGAAVIAAARGAGSLLSLRAASAGPAVAAVATSRLIMQKRKGERLFMHPLSRFEVPASERDGILPPCREIMPKV